jgi:GT2 family glycosyltransferase
MILTCLVTCDRLPYTTRAIDSWMGTVRPQDRLVVVDNASTDGTKEYLDRLHVPVIFNAENRWPGPACNQGWDDGLAQWSPDFLHRADNDISYRAGWAQEVELAFSRHPDLVLLGVLNLHEDRGVELPAGEPGDIEPCDRVGGNVVMRPDLFRDVRWQDGFLEDGPMSAAAHERGTVAMLVRTVADNMAFNRYWDFPAYYDRTAAARGIGDAEHST